jgi:hypothetical protein
MIQKIYNVYQPTYKNGLPTGFGDYLRGSLLLQQLCNEFNIEFDMDVSTHPISTFIDTIPINVNRTEINKCITNNTLLSNGTPAPANIHEVYTKVRNLVNPATHPLLFIYCNGVPQKTPNDTQYYDFIKNKIKPNVVMERLIEEELQTLGLIKNKYIVIHIRMGDACLIDHVPINANLASKIIRMVSNYRKINKSIKCLIISDSHQIKQLFKFYHNCVFSQKQITHLGETQILHANNNSVKNTLLDFYLMSQSQEICGLSCNNCCSAFSNMCAIIYDIPYYSKVVIDNAIKMRF